jgi:fumarylacetoacetase
MTDETHDPARRSWVASANGHPDFPIQNLPLGMFAPSGRSPRGGIAIGDQILDLKGLYQTGLLSGEAEIAAEAASGLTLNALMALGAAPRRALRRAVSRLLSEGSPEQPVIAPLLYAAADCAMHLPARIGDYTDFYAGIHHASNVGRLFRPEAPLLPNYKFVPIGYHGRASSVRISGENVRRPNGQRKPATETVPSFGPSRSLDFELELGIWIGPGNPPGEPVPIAAATDHIAGFCLLNDWSARDLQAWEYQPLGPFLAKSFHTTISPWIVTPEALEPFRFAQAARPDGDPAPLPYLLDETDQSTGAHDIALEVLLTSETMRAQGLPALRLTKTNARELYWTVAQLLTHHASNGCNLNEGDLFGSGTISGAEAGSFGSLLELTKGGQLPITLPSGETRTFLETGDEVTFQAHCQRDGFVSIGFGEARARITA